MKRQLVLFLASASIAAVATPSIASAATTVDWMFTGTNTGSGQITYDEATDLVTALSGTYAGGSLSLVSFLNRDPNNPGAEINDNGGGLYTYRGVPNTGGVNYTFDDKFTQTYNTSGYLASTGIGSDERVYVLNVDKNDGVDQFNFFSINPDGSYRQDFGTFATTPAATGAVPEPASWAMMIFGMGAVGFAMRRRKVTTRVQFA